MSVEMFVRSAGSGVPEMVFVHGFACDHTDWVAQVAEFSPAQAVIACDLRGHGQTPGEPVDCSIETLGADVAQLLAQRDLKEAILVGHSMGTRVVLEAHRRAPERVAGLVLIDGSRMGTGDPAQAEEAMRAAIDFVGFPAFADALFKGMFFTPSTDAARIVGRAKRLPAAIGAALFPRMARWDAANMDAALDAIRVPLMVIQSTTLNMDRKRVPLKEGETTAWLDLVRRRVPSARIEVIPGVSHFPQIDVSARVNALLADFVGSLAEF
ncbi:MAG TPA: alpha/beta fold hydrolase [Burkholderiales bacterium]|nr:alpha/beta fold hydrolase [Burkholderiales bacterium]